MKNLVLVAERRRKLIRSEDEPGVVPNEVRGAAVTSSDVVDICDVYSNGIDEPGRAVLHNDGCLALIRHDHQVAWICQLNDLCPEGPLAVEEDRRSWFQVTFVDPYLVAINYHRGALVTISPDSGVGEWVGEFENGIQAASWSPDREMLLLITTMPSPDDSGGNQMDPKSVMLLLTSQFQVLAEVDMEKHVPWSFTTTTGGRGKEDANKIFVCWRPDGSLCAVSSVDRADGMRRLRIYQRHTLQIHGVGRAEDGSGQFIPRVEPVPLAWAGPSCSQLLAAIQTKGNNTQQLVIFMEPNGLRHGEFSLHDRPDSYRVSRLSWNVESDLLAVTLVSNSKEGSVNHGKVQLWHRCNYYWYLKQEFQFDELPRAQFHEEKPYLLYVFLGSAGLIEYELRWDASTVHPFSSWSEAVVVDGCRLNVTALAQAVVPPPMYAATLDMAAPVSQVAFVPFSPESSEVFAVVSLSTGQLVILGKEDATANVWSKPEIMASPVWPSDESTLDPRHLRNLVVIENRNGLLRLVAVAAAPPNESSETLVCFNVSSEQRGAEIELVASMKLEGRVLAISNWFDDSTGALVQLEDGQLLEYDFSSGDCSLIPSEAEPLLEPCPYIAALKNMEKLETYRHGHRKRLVVGMTSQGRLYCHDILLAPSVSSFVLSVPQRFLCYASSGSRCQLRFLSILELYSFDPLLGSDENYVLEGFEPRNIERGSRLVATLIKTPTVVLQMPRGNLEVVYPRALVMCYTVQKIMERDFREAFQMMRRQKVDLNLIVDIDPHYFLESGVDTFVQQVHGVDHLNLFISGLQDVDSLQTRYRIPEWVWNVDKPGHLLTRKEFDFSTKVNQVCNKVREVMLNEEPERAGYFLLPILSTFAKESPPKLEKALALIRENAMGKANSGKTPLFTEAAQASIQYLAFLADYELLFQTALGMYDFDLARAVARNSQMDPKVYLPRLKRYRALPLYYGRFEVDLRLERFDSALRHLHQSALEGETLTVSEESDAEQMSNDFERCLGLIREHKLHRLGLELFRDAEQRRRIMLSLGDHLLESEQAEAALTVFLAADPPDSTRCLKAARLARDWRTFFTLRAAKDDSHLEPSEGKMATEMLLAKEIADELAADADRSVHRKRLLSDSARILLDYGHDSAGAVEILLRAEQWSEALRIGRLSARVGLIRKCLDAAVSYAYTTMSDVEDRAHEFEGAHQRYVAVLQIRKEASEQVDDLDAEEGEVGDDGSLFSKASNASDLSARTGSSTGSTGSLSSVISVKTATTFTISGADASNRHRSKFNQPGHEKKKKKKRKPKGRTKIAPGSARELESLVATLQSTGIDQDYRDTVAATIEFLCRHGHLEVGRELYESYVRASDLVQKVQATRIAQVQAERLAAARTPDMMMLSPPPALAEVEAKVEALIFPDLPTSLHDFFHWVPAT